MQAADMVRQLYADYRERKLDSVMEMVDEDAEFRWMSNPDNTREFSGVTKGKIAFSERLMTLDEQFEYLDVEILDLIASDDRAAAQVRFTMRRRSTGLEFVTQVGTFWTLRDGKLVDFVEYFDTAQIQGILQQEAPDVHERGDAPQPVALDRTLVTPPQMSQG